MGDGQTVNAIDVGNVYVSMQLEECEPKESMIYKVLYVPKLACNLFSVRAAATRGKSMKFSDDKCWIFNRAGNICGMGSLVDKLYQLDCESVSSEHVSVAIDQGRDIDLWHQRLGHLGRQRLQETVSKQLVNGMDISKTSKLSFVKGASRAKCTGVHLNQWEKFVQLRASYSQNYAELLTSPNLVQHFIIQWGMAWWSG